MSTLHDKGVWVCADGEDDFNDFASFDSAVKAPEDDRGSINGALGSISEWRSVFGSDTSQYARSSCISVQQAELTDVSKHSSTSDISNEHASRMETDSLFQLVAHSGSVVKAATWGMCHNIRRKYYKSMGINDIFNFKSFKSAKELVQSLRADSVSELRSRVSELLPIVEALSKELVEVLEIRDDLEFERESKTMLVQDLLRTMRLVGGARGRARATSPPSQHQQLLKTIKLQYSFSVIPDRQLSGSVHLCIPYDLAHIWRQGAGSCHALSDLLRALQSDSPELYPLLLKYLKTALR